ncbi:hypothetical protein [Flavobacterium sp. H4147]|uniref:hypothetical protein n=1 Tax=Flavobacterium sp. H4147 TaxID=3034149 RepID=UPI0023EB787C|nr:hypothetical protein [Flavobacterium sp. H4147]
MNIRCEKFSIQGDTARNIPVNTYRSRYTFNGITLINPVPHLVIIPFKIRVADAL